MILTSVDSPNAERPDSVAEAIVALPGQAFPILLFVPHGDALLAVASIVACCPAQPLHLVPKGDGPYACHLINQPVHRLDLQR